LRTNAFSSHVTQQDDHLLLFKGSKKAYEPKTSVPCTALDKGTVEGGNYDLDDEVYYTALDYAFYGFLRVPRQVLFLKLDRTRASSIAEMLTLWKSDRLSDSELTAYFDQLDLDELVDEELVGSSN
jgi:hypothetical protein